MAFTQYSYDSVLCLRTVIEMLKGCVVRNKPVYGFSFFLVLDIHVGRVFPREITVKINLSPFHSRDSAVNSQPFYLQAFTHRCHIPLECCLLFVDAIVL